MGLFFRFIVDSGLNVEFVTGRETSSYRKGNEHSATSIKIVRALSSFAQAAAEQGNS
jgi:hypothetical protein